MKRTCTALLIGLLLSGCGQSCAAPVTAGSPKALATSATPTPDRSRPPVPPTAAGPHFATPQQAMTYLADAWNRNDLAALRHVTDSNARDQLLQMHDEAQDLKLDHCSFVKERGDYECYFVHGFPKGYKSKGPIGHAEFTVGPARKPGWYMTYFVDCGG